MGKFHDALAAAFPETEGEEPSEHVASLSAAYDEDFSIPTAAIEQRDADIAQHLTTIADRDTTITGLKSDLFDASKKSGTEPVVEEINETVDKPNVDDFFDEEN
jgi:hypothetical protein